MASRTTTTIAERSSDTTTRSIVINSIAASNSRVTIHDSMTSLEAPLVLITGATGHIGFRTLAVALEAGYRARVSSRSLQMAEKLRSLPSIKPHADKVEFVEIPDFLAPGAFDNAVQGVSYIIHVASPIPDATIPGSGTHFDADHDLSCSV